ncbi:hypothetical protein GCM10011335_22420 [Aureimonas glaciei]|uniref:Uncharacterized protein n=1 Tax=Aureimonas glaciei TaxID=1776957 RepID=A0A917DAQ1_9HYPH|nr:hypothetical protein GCM10011335_22420 [Aureimonas glaciei]
MPSASEQISIIAVRLSMGDPGCIRHRITARRAGSGEGRMPLSATLETILPLVPSPVRDRRVTYGAEAKR